MLFRSGSYIEDQVLTVNNTLADEDGLGVISYQWNRDGDPISNATAETYTLVQNDVGKVITVTASYIDGQGTAESMTSSVTNSITAWGSPSHAPTDKGYTKIVSNSINFAAMNSDGSIIA